MKLFYKLQLAFNPSIETFTEISKILGVSSTDIDFPDFKDFKDSIPSIWSYEVVQAQNDSYFDFINNFLDILENKYDKLSNLGIERDNISFWKLYEYDQQCNLEFDPIRMKRLGDNGITLCISCWDSGEI